LLVCCALGYSRSAATIATWLIASDRTKTLSEGIDKIRQVRPRIVIDGTLRAAIASATERRT